MTPGVVQALRGHDPRAECGPHAGGAAAPAGVSRRATLCQAMPRRTEQQSQSW